MLERSYLSIIRKRGKSIIFAIVMFVIANLIFSTIAIKNATNESVDFAKETLGGEVYLTPDMEKIRSEMSQGTQMMKMERPKVYVDVVEEISDSLYIKDYTYSVSVGANVIDQEVIETDVSKMFGNRMNMGDRGNVQITAINAYAFLPEVESNSIELIDGDYFNEENAGSVMISNDFAILNDLEVGDILKLQNIETEEDVEYSIIGIYESTEDDDENSIMSSGNTMYMNITSSFDLMTESSYNEGNYAVSNAVFYLDNAENKDIFINEINSEIPEIEENNLMLDIDTQSYEQMAGPIESVGTSATTIMIVVIVAAVIIITLIVNSQIKERKYEMGVLMSLGESKKNILLQIILEFVIIATVAFLLSTVSSLFVAQTMSSSILDNQISMTEIQSENNFGRGNMMKGMMGVQTTTEVEVIDEINVSMNVTDYILLFLVGYGIILVSLIVPAVNIMKYEPKTILTRREN